LTSLYWENTENLAHVRNIQERETQEVDEKEVSISEKQKSDKDLTLIRKWVERGEKPELKEITGESITVKSMWAQFEQLTIIDDVLVRRNLLHIPLHPFANLANNTPV
jgi:hypothetical protein